MSATLREGELRVDLPSSARGRKFDDQTHRLSHCMKAVDWIIDLPDEIYFVEVKDLDAPGAVGHSQRERYFDDLKAGRNDRDLVTKFRDSFIYRWACGQVDKPIFYLVVIACEDLDGAMLLHRSKALRRQLPSGVPKVWRHAIAKDVLVFNERTWNEKFADFPMTRIRDEPTDASAASRPPARRG